MLIIMVNGYLFNYNLSHFILSFLCKPGKTGIFGYGPTATCESSRKSGYSALFFSKSLWLQFCWSHRPMTMTLLKSYAHDYDFVEGISIWLWLCWSHKHMTMTLLKSWTNASDFANEDCLGLIIPDNVAVKKFLLVLVL